MQSLEQSSDARLCYGRTGRTWICPRWIIDYDQIEISAEA